MLATNKMEKVKYTREEYRNEYLKSGEWKNLRNLIMSSHPDCQCCGNNATDVHHMTYRNIVDITVEDLLPVCRKCHDLIHDAIRDGHISQESQKIKEIKEKTLDINSSQEYKDLRKWLDGKHSLSENEMNLIKSDYRHFIMRRIGGLIKSKIWYEDLPERKFTGRQIIKIREIIKTVLYRRKEGMDKGKTRSKTKTWSMNGGKSRKKRVSY